MIDMQVLTKAVETALRANATLISAAVNIERSKVVNMDPGKCPWLGVYPGPHITSLPKSLGSGNARWNNVVEVSIIVQTSSFNQDGQTASDLLETLAQEALAVINADLTVAVTGARVVEVARQYLYLVDDSKESGDLYMPQVNMVLKMEVRSA